MPSSMGEPQMLNPDETGQPAPGYETRDTNASYVLVFLAALLMVLGTTLFGMLLLFRYFSVVQRYPAPPSSFAGVRQIPLEPELQVHARRDLLNVYASQERELNTYAWEDRGTGAVRIPIERAMDLLIKKSLTAPSSVFSGSDAQSETPVSAGPNESGKKPSSPRGPGI